MLDLKKSIKCIYPRVIINLLKFKRKMKTVFPSEIFYALKMYICKI